MLQFEFEDLLHGDRLHIVLNATVLLQLTVVLFLELPLSLLLFLLPTFVLLFVFCAFLCWIEFDFLANLGASDGPRAIQVEIIGSNRLLSLIHHGRIGISFASLIQFFDLGVMIVQVCDQPSHAIDRALKVKSWGHNLDTWGVPNVFTWEVCHLAILAGLSTVLDVLWGLLKLLDILFLTLLVLLSHSHLLLLLHVILLILFADFRDADHFACAGIEILNVHIGVTVYIDVRIEKHQLSDGLGLFRDSPKETLRDFRALILRIFASGYGTFLILKHPADITEL